MSERAIVNLNIGDFYEIMQTPEAPDRTPYLVVPAQPTDDEDYRIVWHHQGEPPPWQPEDYVARIPSIYPAGRENELVEEFLEAYFDPAESERIRAECAAAGKSLFDWVKEYDPERWWQIEKDTIDDLYTEWVEDLNNAGASIEQGKSCDRPYPLFEMGVWC